MKNLEKAFKAFGNISRLKILKYLKGRRDASVEEIAEGAGCSYKATSKHLGILYRTNIVDREQSRFEMRYRIGVAKSDPLYPLLELF